MNTSEQNHRDSEALIAAIVNRDHASYVALVAEFPNHPRPDLCNAVLYFEILEDVNERLNGMGALERISASGALGEGGMSPSGWSDAPDYLGRSGHVIGEVERHGWYHGPTYTRIKIEFEKVGPDWKPVTDEIMSWFR